jgi:hypothetical protein
MVPFRPGLPRVVQQRAEPDRKVFAGIGRRLHYCEDVLVER